MSGRPSEISIYLFEIHVLAINLSNRFFALHHFQNRFKGWLLAGKPVNGFQDLANRAWLIGSGVIDLAANFRGFFVELFSNAQIEINDIFNKNKIPDLLSIASRNECTVTQACSDRIRHNCREVELTRPEN